MDYNHPGAATATATATDYQPTQSSNSDADPIEVAPPANPFTSPYGSVPTSAMGSSTGLQSVQPPRYFHSRRIQKGVAERPWLEKKDPKQKWVTIIPLLGILLGFGLTGFLVWDGLKTVADHTYCDVLIMDDFSNGLDPKIWTKEAEVGGFGNGEFEQTTTTDENVFVQDGMLVIKPTLQDESLVNNNNVINLLQDGSCSSDVWSNCVVSTNTTNGTIVNPVKSGRLNTKLGATIKYGRIEVVAKLPAGDWLWPAIWLLPVNNTYGDWPASGEIDIVESRGNNYTYAQGGDNIISSTLHWGPDSTDDAFWKTNNKAHALLSTYSAGFHTFGLEWSEKYLFTYVDSRLAQVNTYGDWPASGEIDIVESRGNNYTYGQGGNNIISSTLHWGPDSTDDAFWKTNNKANALHTTFNAGFHTFGLEWSEKYLFTYVDSRLAQVLYTKFDGPLWQKGNFPAANSNGTRLIDPWSQTGRDSTPFDQDFYLILNVAVGGTNGWFADGQSGKPWVDASPTARADFWNARAQWYPTWQDTGMMTIKSVKMYQQQGYNGC
nr:beta-1,3-glucan-binding protein [Quercus suber]